MEPSSNRLMCPWSFVKAGYLLLQSNCSSLGAAKLRTLQWKKSGVSCYEALSSTRGAFLLKHWGSGFFWLHRRSHLNSKPQAGSDVDKTTKQVWQRIMTKFLALTITTISDQYYEIMCPHDANNFTQMMKKKRSDLPLVVSRHWDRFAYLLRFWGFSLWDFCSTPIKLR